MRRVLVVGDCNLQISRERSRWKENKGDRTFFMIGSTASALLDDADAAARPLGMCESGTRTGLCRRMDRFF